MANKKKLSILWNVIFILFVLLLPIIDAPTRNPTKLLFLDNAYVVIDFISHFLCLAFVYFNFYYLAPNFYFQNQKVMYFIFVFVIFMLIAAVPDFIEDNVYTYRIRMPEHQRIHILIQIRHIFFIFFSLFSFSLYRLTEIKRLESDTQKSLMEINFLKAQINPHFLFNTLNSIYALTLTNATEAGKALIKMTNIMRYMMQSSHDDKVSLQTAADYLDDFIDLQKARFGDTLQIDKQINIEPNSNYSIATLVLLPFIENAFKYGVYPSEPSDITIQLYNKGAQLYFFVGNNNYSQIITDQESHKIGIQNTKKRLKQIYGYKHELKILNTSKSYRVALTINMRKDDLPQNT